MFAATSSTSSLKYCISVSSHIPGDGGGEGGGAGIGIDGDGKGGGEGAGGCELEAYRYGLLLDGGYGGSTFIQY